MARHWRLPAILGALALLLSAAAIWFLRDGAAADDRADELVAEAAFTAFEASASPPVRPATPLLSARRVPSRLVEPAAREDLADELEAIVAASPVSTCLVVSEAGEDLYSHQPNLPVIPASAMKLVTALGVLDVLGSDYRFVTEVRAVGGVVDGTIAGDLWLVGGGDPILATDGYIAGFEEEGQRHTDFEAVADAIVAAGVTRITGRIVGDESRYDTERSIDAWPERFVTGNQTGPLSALLVDDGLVGFPPNSRRAASAEAVDSPATYAAGVLTDLLVARNVAVAGAPGAGTAPDDSAVVAAHESAPATEAMQQMLSRSDNTTAELLNKEIGFEASGTGSSNAGSSARLQALTDAGLATDGVVLGDGSGLDANSRLTCGLLDDLLEQQGTGSAVDDGLAVAGESGTLRKRFIGTDAQGRLRAKTGTLNQATALTGFVTTLAGRELVFSYVANDEFITGDTINLQNDLAQALVTYPQGPPLDQLGPKSTSS